MGDRCRRRPAVASCSSRHAACWYSPRTAIPCTPRRYADASVPVVVSIVLPSVCAPPKLTASAPLPAHWPLEESHHVAPRLSLFSAPPGHSFARQAIPYVHQFADELESITSPV